MSDSNDPKWERKLLEELALATLREQRTRRRWSIFFRFVGFAYLVAVLVLVVDWGGAEKLADGKHTALINLEGTIESKGDASAENLVAALQAAFEDRGTSGVVLRINSPGGSPVQAGIIHDEIRRLRTRHPDTPLYVVIEDICASGGYYVAAAADRIFVDKASIVGSIGVLMDGFGFTGTLDRLGVQRRLLTAGSNKGFLDPFSPESPEQRQHAQTMLDEIHAQFIKVVREGRGERLKDAPEIFSGLMWTGARSIELGLADSFGTVDSVARDVIQAERILDYSPKENIAERFAKRLGADVAGRFLGDVLGTGPALR